MQILGIKTHKITGADTNIFSLLDRYVTDLSENSILAITSKIVSICDGRIRPMSETDKDELVREESQRFIDKHHNAYGMYLTIAQGRLAATAGIDESNGNGFFVLWPEDAYQSAHDVRTHLKNKFSLKNLGVIITDSTTTPLQWGTVGISIGHAGITPLRDYIGTPDLFNHEMRVTKSSIVNGIAAASVLAMGEGAEQTPLAIVTDVPDVEFRDTNPEEEKKALAIEPDTDLYATLLKHAPWENGKKPLTEASH